MSRRGRGGPGGGPGRRGPPGVPGGRPPGGGPGRGTRGAPGGEGPRRGDGDAPGAGEAVVVDLDALDAEGDAVGRVVAGPRAGEAARVALALPGERVRVALGRPEGGGARRGRLLEVVRAAPERVGPACPHFGVCGGCAWQHLAYPAQLEAKRARVADLLARAVGRAVPVLPAVAPGGAPLPFALPPGADPAAPWGFRNKVHYVLGPAGRGERGPTLGHYRRGSQDLVPIAACPVHDPRGERLARAAREALARARIPGVDERRLGRGPAPAGVRHVLVRTSPTTGQALLTLVATTDRLKGLGEAVAALVEGSDPPDGVHLDVHDGPGSLILGGGEGRKLHGRERLLEEVAGARFLVSPRAFFQTSARGAARLVEAVLARVPADGAPVLDLFAGCGLFSLPLARRGHRVLAVEESRPAAADAAASRRASGVDDAACRHLAERAEVAVRRLLDGSLRAPPAPTVVLDPPRDGCAPGLLDDVLLGLRPARVVYVSCNPEALAADAARAARHGWRVAEALPVDLFPHGPHVETVAVLTPPVR